MHCSFCGQPYESTDRFCAYCGAAIAPPPKKGRLWPAIIALTVVFAIGLGVFLLFPSTENTGYDPATPWYVLIDGELYFYEDAYTGGSVLTVPSSIGGQRVKALGDGCFYDCDSLVAIHLPNTVTDIGAEAFADCDKLRAVRLSDGLTTLDSGAFYNCPRLESVTIPETLTRAGADIFTGCDRLSYLFYSGTLENFKALNFRGIPAGAVLSCDDGLYTLN